MATRSSPSPMLFTKELLSTTSLHSDADTPSLKLSRTSTLLSVIVPPTSIVMPRSKARTTPFMILTFCFEAPILMPVVPRLELPPTSWPFRSIVMSLASTMSPSPSQGGVSCPRVIDVVTCMPQVGSTGPGFGLNGDRQAMESGQVGGSTCARAEFPPPSTAPASAVIAVKFPVSAFLARVVVALVVKMPLSLLPTIALPLTSAPSELVSISTPWMPFPKMRLPTIFVSSASLLRRTPELPLAATRLPVTVTGTRWPGSPTPFVRTPAPPLPTIRFFATTIAPGRAVASAREIPPSAFRRNWLDLIVMCVPPRVSTRPRPPLPVTSAFVTVTVPAETAMPLVTLPTTAVPLIFTVPPVGASPMPFSTAEPLSTTIWSADTRSPLSTLPRSVTFESFTTFGAMPCVAIPASKPRIVPFLMTTSLAAVASMPSLPASPSPLSVKPPRSIVIFSPARTRPSPVHV